MILHSIRKGPASQRGVALFVTLIMITLILMTMATLSYQHQLEFRRNAHAYSSEQVLLLVLSGESWAKKTLLDDSNNNSTDSFDDIWAQALPLLPVEGGTLTGCLMDLQARYNLNNFGAYSSAQFSQDLSSTGGSGLRTYLNLLSGLELNFSEERAAAIIDWIDADNSSVSAGGAEDNEYSLEDPPRLAPNTFLSDPSELVSVYGYSAADLILMDGFVAALPRVTGINVNTASPRLLASLAPSVIDDYMIEQVLENRPFNSISDFYAFVANETGFMTVPQLQLDIPPTLLSVSSSYFQLYAEVDLSGIRMSVRSLFERDGVGGVRTLSRRFETIPRIELEEGQIDPLISPCIAPQNSVGVTT